MLPCPSPPCIRLRNRPRTPHAPRSALGSGRRSRGAGLGKRRRRGRLAGGEDGPNRDGWRWWAAGVGGWVGGWRRGAGAGRDLGLVLLVHRLGARALRRPRRRRARPGRHRGRRPASTARGSGLRQAAPSVRQSRAGRAQGERGIIAACNDRQGNLGNGQARPACSAAARTAAWEVRRPPPPRSPAQFQMYEEIS